MIYNDATMLKLLLQIRKLLGRGVIYDAATNIATHGWCSFQGGNGYQRLHTSLQVMKAISIISLFMIIEEESHAWGTECME